MKVVLSGFSATPNKLYVYTSASFKKRKIQKKAVFCQWRYPPVFQNLPKRHLWCQKIKLIIPWGNVLPNTCLTWEWYSAWICIVINLVSVSLQALESSVCSATWNNRISTVFQIKLAGILLDFDAKSCWLVFIKEKNRNGEDSKSLKIATRR